MKCGWTHEMRMGPHKVRMRTQQLSSNCRNNSPCTACSIAPRLHGSSSFCQVGCDKDSPRCGRLIGVFIIAPRERDSEVVMRK